MKENLLGMSVSDFLTNKWTEEDCEVRCNNCMTYYESDDDLTIMFDNEDSMEGFKGCRICETDGYLMDRD